MSDTSNENKVTEAIEATEAVETETEYSLNDDRRVRTLSPTMLVVRRFLRNRVAVSGLIILAAMFVFSFLGGVLSPYREDQLFYRYDEQNKQFAAVVQNNELRYVTEGDDDFPMVARAKFVLALKGEGDTFESNGVNYRYVLVTADSVAADATAAEGDAAASEGDGVATTVEATADTLTVTATAEPTEELYEIYVEGGSTPVALATYDTVSSASSNDKLPFGFQRAALVAAATGSESFSYEGAEYAIDDTGAITAGGEVVAYASRYVVSPLMSDVFLSQRFKEELLDAIEAGEGEFSFTDDEGTTADYVLSYDASKSSWSVMQSISTKVYDTYGSPSAAHPLGTDRNGMDMMTRLMYGGRVSLYIGFIVVAIETIIGAIMGGISGYFGGWVDDVIMRVVDVFYCIPSMPLIIILGAAMDQMRVDPQIRMIYLMLLLGFLGWPGIARLVRGQILSLREQEFMTAAEATGISVRRRIFRHLIPNVIPQLIVTMTMGLGDTIITEATLSFLGLGVKFPFASWGNIINDVNDTYVLTNYLFIWIPAGVCLLATVLAFNLVGDGLRDAFDPKMKR